MAIDEESALRVSRRRVLIAVAGGVCLLRARPAHAALLFARPISGSFLEDVSYTLREADLGADTVTYRMRAPQGSDDVVIEGLARIDAPLNQVFAVLTDFANFKTWMPTVTASAVRYRMGHVTVVRVTHSVPVLGSFDCQQNYRVREEPGRKVIDAFITYCVVDASRSRYVLEPAGASGSTLVHYYQQARLNAWIPRSLMNRYVQREYRHAGEGLRARVHAVSRTGVRTS